MHVYAITRDVSLTIVDEKGLVNFLSTILDRERRPVIDEAHEKTASLISRYIGAKETKIDSDMSLTFKICGRYHADDWNVDLAPFVEGYIEWRDEDGDVWRDVYEDGMVLVEQPIFYWSADEITQREKQAEEAIQKAQEAAEENERLKERAKALEEALEESREEVKAAKEKARASSEYDDDDEGWLDDGDEEEEEETGPKKESVTTTRLYAICEMGMRYQELLESGRIKDEEDFDAQYEIVETISATYTKYFESGQLRIAPAAFLEAAIERNDMLCDAPEIWHEESWDKDDLKNVLKQNGVEDSEKNIEKLQEECIRLFKGEEKARCNEIVSIVRKTFLSDEPKGHFGPDSDND